MGRNLDDNVHSARNQQSNRSCALAWAFKTQQAFLLEADAPHSLIAGTAFVQPGRLKTCLVCAGCMDTTHHESEQHAMSLLVRRLKQVLLRLYTKTVGPPSLTAACRLADISRAASPLWGT
jgi:hypothetical protein